MKNSVVVIRIDKSEIEQAKQVYFCVKRNANWSGDFLIFSHLVPEKDLVWFRKKGIYIKKCKPLFSVGRWSAMTISKLYIFSPYIKRWKHVVYLDTDVIVNTPINKLTTIKGFAASADIEEQLLSHQVILECQNDWEILNKIENMFGKKFNIFQTSFNDGVFAFNTDIIDKGTFKKIISALQIASPICRFGEQTIVNLYFYGQWQKLPRVFNLVPRIYLDRFKVPRRKLRAIIFHFAGIDNPSDKPWNPKNKYYQEWMKNSDTPMTTYNKPNIDSAEWSNFNIWLYDRYLHIKRLSSYNYIDIKCSINNTFRFLFIEFKELIKTILIYF